MSRSIGDLLLSAWQTQTGGDPDGSVYDEVLREVSARASRHQSLGKADIGALVFWKRITAQAAWSTRLLLVPDDEVRNVTHQAFLRAGDSSAPSPEAGQRARDALFALPGLGGTGALASAVLLALAPERMAVWDRRVQAALVALRCAPKPGPGFYGRYLHTLSGLGEQISAATGAPGRVRPRDVDLALFAIGGSTALLAQAQTLR